MGAKHILYIHDYCSVWTVQLWNREALAILLGMVALIGDCLGVMVGLSESLRGLEALLNG
jgi:hypothetical protein